MECGELTEEIYERSVVKVMRRLNGAGLRADCAILTGSTQNIQAQCSQAMADGLDTEVAARAYIAAVNQLKAGCAGRDLPYHDTYANLILTVPETFLETKVRCVMEEAAKIADKMKIPILCCNVQVLSSVKEAVAVCVISASAGSESRSDSRISCHFGDRKALPGEEIVMTKWAALEGTALIARGSSDQLCTRLPADLIAAASAFYRYLPVEEEAAYAGKSGASYLLMPRKGGIFGGLWQLAAENGVGLVADLKQIPIRQETIEICEYFDINPYRLLAGGSLLITTPNSGELVRKLTVLGVEATVIGYLVEGNDRVVCHNGETRFLEPVRGDEIFRYKKITEMRYHE